MHVAKNSEKPPRHDINVAAGVDAILAICIFAASKLALDELLPWANASFTQVALPRIRGHWTMPYVRLMKIGVEGYECVPSTRLNPRAATC